MPEYSLRRLAAVLDRMQRDIRDLQIAPQLQNSSVEVPAADAGAEGGGTVTVTLPEMVGKATGAQRVAAQVEADLAEARTEIDAAIAERDERIAEAIQKGTDAATVAGTAASTASAAQEKADQALSAASGAEQKALEAAGLAGSKGEVIYQVSAPTGSRANPANLWIRTTDNKPHTYDPAQSKWVAVESKVATDAAAAAAAAATAASDAMTRANEAHTLAGQAAENAQTALSSANGKNKVMRSTAAPSGQGTAEGDLWWRFADNTWRRVVGQWLWSGSSWIPAGLGHEVISSVDVGTLTVAGQATLAQAVIDVLWAQVVNARKITADMVLIGSGSNMLGNPDFENNGAGWSTPTGTSFDTSSGKDGSGSVLIPASSTQNGSYYGQYDVGQRPRVEAARAYRVSAWVRSNAAIAAGRAAIYVRAYGDQTGSTYGWASPSNVSNTETIPANTWGKVEGIVAIPEGYTQAVVGLIKQSTHADAMRWCLPSLTPATDASLIVDGAVLARHINVVDLTASAAFIERVRSLGIRLVNEHGEVMMNLSGVDEQMLTIPDPTTGDTVVSLDNTGRGTFKSISAADSLLYKGRELDTLLDRPQGLVAIGGLGQVSSVEVPSGIEYGLFDVPVPKRTGWYKATVSLVTYPLGGTDREVQLNLKHSPLNQGVVVASPHVTGRTLGKMSATQWDSKTAVMWFRGSQLTLSSGGYSRLLLTCLFQNGNGRVDPNTTLTVEHIATEELPFTQTVNTGGASWPSQPTPPAPPTSSKITRTDVFNMSSWRSFTNGGANSLNGDLNRTYAMQGYTPYWPAGGLQLSEIYFDSAFIRSVLSGSTIEAVSVHVRNVHWYQGSGGIVRLHRHNVDGPASTGASQALIAEASMGRGEDRWIEINPSFGVQLRDGVARGIGLVPASTSPAYYGYFDPLQFQIAVRHTK